MALFKIATEDNGSVKKYTEEQDLYNLVSYVYNNSYSVFLNRLVGSNAELISHQMSYCQRCMGKTIERRALHFILSYDTGRWEWEMTRELVTESITYVVFCMNQLKLRDYQYMIAAHDNDNNLHLHIVINPVNVLTGKQLNYSIGEFESALKELAQILYSKYRLTLAPVSDINENGRLVLGHKKSGVYGNTAYPWDSHLKFF